MPAPPDPAADLVDATAAPAAAPSPAPAAAPAVPAGARPATWLRLLWLTAGVLALGTGIVGIFVPLLPTTPLVLLAGWCFSRGCSRCERWLLAHPRLGPMVRDWRAHRAMPLRAKQLAWLMMAIGSVWAWRVLPVAVCWLPALCCAAVAVWMWRLPTRVAGRANPPAG